MHPFELFPRDRGILIAAIGLHRFDPHGCEITAPVAPLARPAIRPASSTKNLSGHRTRRANQVIVLHIPSLSSAQHALKNPSREQSIFMKRIKLVAVFKMRAQKYSAFAFPEFDVCFPHSGPSRGAYASSRTWSGMRWTGMGLTT
jgi:hypothetical protein